MAGHGMNTCGTKQTGGRRKGLEVSTKGRAKPVPPRVALKRELQQQKERSAKGIRR